MRLVGVLALALAACVGEPTPPRAAPRPSAAVDPSRPSRVQVKQRPDEPDDDVQPCAPSGPTAPDLPAVGDAPSPAPGPAQDAPKRGPSHR